MSMSKGKLKKTPFNELTLAHFPVGITMSSVKDIMYAGDFKRFTDWIDGQTVAVGHSNEVVVFADDLARFLKNLPCVD